MSNDMQDLVDEDQKQPSMAEITITLDEASEIYGVTKECVRRWIGQGKVRGYRFGDRRIRVLTEDMESLYVPIGPGGI